MKSNLICSILNWITLFNKQKALFMVNMFPMLALQKQRELGHQTLWLFVVGSRAISHYNYILVISNFNITKIQFKNIVLIGNLKHQTRLSVLTGGRVSYMVETYW